jgi:DNA-directed RNA polymerase alpha subunit
MVDKWSAKVEKIQIDYENAIRESNTLYNNLITSMVTFGQRGKEQREKLKQIMTEWWIDYLDLVETFNKEWNELVEKQAQ